MKDYAKKFYLSRAWIKARTAYKKKIILCERCQAAGIIKPGEIVHHIRPITPGNIGDDNITLNPDNFMLLCRDCHAAIHAGHQKRYTIDAAGRAAMLPGPEEPRTGGSSFI